MMIFRQHVWKSSMTLQAAWNTDSSSTHSLRLKMEVQSPETMHAYNQLVTVSRRILHEMCFFT